MEQQRYYFQVGLFISVMFVLFVGTIGWFTVHSDEERYTTYAIYFSDSVDGLSMGSPVRYKGITVGAVTKLSFARNDQVLVLIDIMSSTPVRNDTVASMQLLGITGTSFIALDNQGTDPTPKIANPDEDYPVIASRPSPIDKVLSSVPELMEEMQKLSVRGQLLLSDENIAEVNNTLKSIGNSAKSLESMVGEGETKNMASAMGELNETLAEAKLTMREIRMLARTLREDPSLVLYGPKHEGKNVP